MKRSFASTLILLFVCSLLSCESSLTLTDENAGPAPDSVKGAEDQYIELPTKNGYTLSPDGLHIVIRDNDTLQIRDTKTGNIVREVLMPAQTGSRSPFKIDNELTRVHMGVALYDIRGMTAVKVASVNASSILTPDGSSLIERSLRDLIVHSGLISVTLSIPDMIVNSFGYCHELKAVVIVAHLKRIIIWSIDTDQEIGSIPAPDAATSNYYVSADGKTLWTSGPGDSTDYFDILARKKITTIRNPVQLNDGSSVDLGLPLSRHYASHVTIGEDSCIIKIINIKDRTVWATKVVPVPCGPTVLMSHNERTLAAYLSNTCQGYDPGPRVRIWRFW